MITEWIVLADYVEFASGKLYMIGGGWDNVTINHPSRLHNFGVATAFRVDWNEIDAAHEVVLSLSSVESPEPLVELQALLELAGGSIPEVGSTQLAQWAMNMSVEFNQPGVHLLTTTIDGKIDRQLPFTVRFGKQMFDPASDIH